MKQLSVGIVGCGRIGQTHARNLAQMPQFKIVASFDPFANGLVENHYQDYIKFLKHDELEAVLICSPSDKHIEHVLHAAKSRKAIFCEKPLGLNEPDIIEAVSVCKQYQVPLQIGFNRRFDPCFSQLKQNFKQLSNQKPHCIKITSRDPKIPDENYIANSGGIFFDMMIHDFDMARFLCDDEVKSIHAMGDCLIDPIFQKYNDVDTALVQLTMNNGTMVVIENSRQTAFGYDQRIEIYNHQACVKADNQLSHHVQLRDKQGLHSANFQPFFLERYSQAYQLQMNAFYRSVIDEQEVAVDGHDGLMSLRLAQAAKQSLETKQVINLE